MKSLVQQCSVRRLTVIVFAAVAGCVGLAGCVADGGYDGGVDVGYDVGFYEPFGYEYGGWGPGYRVGPPRRGFDRGRGDVHGGAPHSSYRPAAPSRSMPSLPTRSRGR
jgi:hypothetical protein